MKALRKILIWLLIFFAAALYTYDFNMSEMMSAFGITSRYDAGYEAGYLAGLEDGTESGYNKGYKAGFKDGENRAKDYYAARELAKELWPNASKASSSSSSSATWVYVTDTGSKYHKSGCSYLKSSNKIELSEALSLGYDACSRCY